MVRQHKSTRHSGIPKTINGYIPARRANCTKQMRKTTSEHLKLVRSDESTKKLDGIAAGNLMSRHTTIFGGTMCLFARDVDRQRVIGRSRISQSRSPPRPRASPVTSLAHFALRDRFLWILNLLKRNRSHSKNKLAPSRGRGSEGMGAWLFHVKLSLVKLSLDLRAAVNLGPSAVLHRSSRSMNLGRSHIGIVEILQHALVHTLIPETTFVWNNGHTPDRIS